MGMVKLCAEDEISLGRPSSRARHFSTLHEDFSLHVVIFVDSKHFIYTLFAFWSPLCPNLRKQRVITNTERP